MTPESAAAVLATLPKAAQARASSLGFLDKKMRAIQAGQKVGASEWLDDDTSAAAGNMWDAAFPR